MDESATLQIGLLGGFAVRVGTRGIPEESWRLRNAAHVVKLLALAPGHRLHREAIADTLWPDLPPASATNNLHQTLYRARRVLEPNRSTARTSSFLRLRGNLLVLSPHTLADVDVDRFRAAAVAARRRRDPEAYEAALAHYRGDLLPEDRFDDWIVGPREELRALWLALLIEFAGLCADRGERKRAIEACTAAVAADPTHEEAQTELIRLYAAIGQPARAIRQFERFKDSVWRELGTKPPAAITRFVRDLIDGRLDESAWRRTRRDADNRSPV